MNASTVDLVADALVHWCDAAGHPLERSRALDLIVGEFGCTRPVAGTYLRTLVRRGAFIPAWGGRAVWPALFPPPPPMPRSVQRPRRFGSVWVLAALLAAPATAAAELRPPFAVTLPPGKPVTRTITDYPAAAKNRDVFITLRGEESDVLAGERRACRRREVFLPNEFYGAVIAWVDACRRYTRIRMLSTTHTVRVSLHTYYDIRKGGPEPPEVITIETPALVCTMPDGTPVEVEVIPFSRAASRFRVALARPVAP